MVNEGTKDKLEGKAKEAMGNVREKAGEATDNEEMEAEGRADQMEGKADQLQGDVKNKAEELKDKVTGN